MGTALRVAWHDSRPERMQPKPRSCEGAIGCGRRTPGRSLSRPRRCRERLALQSERRLGSGSVAQPTVSDVAMRSRATQ